MLLFINLFVKWITVFMNLEKKVKEFVRKYSYLFVKMLIIFIILHTSNIPRLYFIAYKVIYGIHCSSLPDIYYCLVFLYYFVVVLHVSKVVYQYNVSQT